MSRDRTVRVECSVLTDEQVVERIRVGEYWRMEELIGRYRQRLYAFLYQQEKSREVADDLFQETWLRVVKSLARFDARAKFSTWLFQIALNLSRDRFRAERRADRIFEGRSSSNEEGNKVILDAAVAKEPSPEQGVLESEQQRNIKRLVGRLPDKLRDVVVLRFFHQASEQEIAEILSVPVGTVKSRLHSALKQMRGEWS